MEDPILGRVLKDTYRIDQLLADGGMSRVYVAEQLSLSRKVAVKMLLPGFNDDDFIQLFLREARIYSQINHPNVVGVIDFGQTEDGLVYMVMEYLDGQTLGDVITDKGGLRLANIVWIMEQVCAGIHIAHKLNIVHRDLKPNNIIVARSSVDTTVVKVLDFGISKPLSEDDLKHTQMGMVMGTPGYLAPEQIEGRRDLDLRADIYALGAMLYYMATGQRPFSGASRELIMGKQLKGPPEALSAEQLNDAECAKLEPVIQKAMALDRDARYGDVKALWEDLLFHSQSMAKSEHEQRAKSEQGGSAPTRYQFIYKGELESGVNLDEAKQSLGTALKLTEQQVDRLFSGKRIIFRKNLAEKDARRFEQLFAKGGARGIVEEMPVATVVAGSGEKLMDSRSLPTAGMVEPVTLTSIQKTIQSSAPIAASSGVSHPSGDSNSNSSRTNPLLKWAVSGLLILVILFSSVWLNKSWRYRTIDRWMDVVFDVQPPRGVSPDKVRLGMSAAFSGSAREIGRSMRLGVETYLKLKNDAGGIHGRLIELESLNDGYEPEQAVENLKAFVDAEKGVFALIGNVGTPTAKAILPSLLEHRMLLFGAFSGASLLRRSPPDRYVFNYRASYAEETSAIIHYFVKVKGIDGKRIAVFYQDDSYGKDGLSGVLDALREYDVKPSEVVRAAYQRNTAQIESAVREIIGNLDSIDAIVQVSTYSASAEFTRVLRRVGFEGRLANVSFVGSRALAENFQEIDPALGAGIIVTQVVPPFSSFSTGVLRYREALQQYYPNEQPDFISLEGFIVAAIFCEALERVGRHFTEEEVINALEKMRNYELGIGAKISFSADDHQASHRVWGAVLNAEGQYEELNLDRLNIR